MDDNQSRSPTDQGKVVPDTAGKPDPGPGPLGRTRREEQRRRLIVAGLSTPALMTLPSRRVWAAKCTKSKMMSGNLSAKKKKGSLECEPMGCGKSFWEKGNPIGTYGNGWTMAGFNTELGADICDSGVNMLTAVNNGATINNAGNRFGNDKKDCLKELKEAACEFGAAYLNATFINWPPPNDQFNFSLTTADVSARWSSGIMWLPPGDPDPLNNTFFAQSDALHAALNAGYWANRYKFYEDEGDGGRKSAAEDLFKEYRDHINDFKDEMKTASETGKVCPFS